jgi:hypothetical protein
LANPLLKKPEIIVINNTEDGILLVSENSINLINFAGKSLDGFPLNINNIKDATIANYPDKSPSRLLVISNTELLNYNSLGEKVIGWQTPSLSSPLKSEIHIQSIHNSDYIYMSDNMDSLYIFSRKGELKIKSKFDLTFSNNSNKLSKGQNHNDIKLMSLKDNYIENRYLVNELQDSIQLQYKPTANTIFWTFKNEKNQLVIEEYNRILIYNEYGLLEQEIQKPQPNLTLLLESNINSNYYVFGNLTKNELYLLDNFGQQTNKKPINGGNNHLIIDDQLLVYFDSQIWIYDLK